jgi:hypothetical protein
MFLLQSGMKLREGRGHRLVIGKRKELERNLALGVENELQRISEQCLWRLLIRLCSVSSSRTNLPPFLDNNWSVVVVKVGLQLMYAITSTGVWRSK